MVRAPLQFLTAALAALPLSLAASAQATAAATAPATIFGEQPRQFLAYALDSSALSIRTSRHQIRFDLTNPMGVLWKVIDLDRATQALDVTVPVDDADPTQPRYQKQHLTPGASGHGAVLIELRGYLQQVQKGNPFASTPENPELQEAVDDVARILCAADHACP